MRRRDVSHWWPSVKSALMSARMSEWATVGKIQTCVRRSKNG